MVCEARARMNPFIFLAGENEKSERINRKLLIEPRAGAMSARRKEFIYSL